MFHPGGFPRKHKSIPINLKEYASSGPVTLHLRENTDKQAYRGSDLISVGFDNSQRSSLK